MRERLTRLGLVDAHSHLLSFAIHEGHAAWPEVAHLLATYEAIDLCWNEYSARELCAASYVDVRPDWHHGYPMPDTNSGYLHATFDLQDYCPRCGAGATQRAPFRMRSEPKWGRRSVLQLNWVFDEFFVRPELYAEVFEPHGVASLPVLHHRTGNALQTVVQLKATADTVDLSIPGTTGQVCERCGRFKYLPLGRAQPSLRVPPPLGHLLRSRQIFGSGAKAFRLVLMSASLFQRYADSSSRGVGFGVVEQRHPPVG